MTRYEGPWTPRHILKDCVELTSAILAALAIAAGAVVLTRL